MDVYYFSLTGQTKRLVSKLETKYHFEITDDNHLIAKQDFILIVPTYAEIDTNGNYSQSVLDPVFDFMDENKDQCKGVIGTGNLNFGELFCWTATEISRDYDVPILLKLEFSGTDEEVKKINKLISEE